MILSRLSRKDPNQQRDDTNFIRRRLADKFIYVQKVKHTTADCTGSPSSYESDTLNPDICVEEIFGSGGSALSSSTYAKYSISQDTGSGTLFKIERKLYTDSTCTTTTGTSWDINYEQGKCVVEDNGDYRSYKLNFYSSYPPTPNIDGYKMAFYATSSCDTEVASYIGPLNQCIHKGVNLPKYSQVTACQTDQTFSYQLFSDGQCTTKYGDVKSYTTAPVYKCVDQKTHSGLAEFAYGYGVYSSKKSFATVSSLSKSNTVDQSSTLVIALTVSLVGCGIITMAIFFYRYINKKNGQVDAPGGSIAPAPKELTWEEHEAMRRRTEEALQGASQSSDRDNGHHDKSKHDSKSKHGKSKHGGHKSDHHKSKHDSKSKHKEKDESRHVEMAERSS